MTSELERLIEEQAKDMRLGHQLQRQGEPWMHAVISLDGSRTEKGSTGRAGPLSDTLDNQGRLHTQYSESRTGMAWSCVFHGKKHSSLDSMGRPQCAECHREHMRAYSSSPKGRAREKAYRARPGVREKRLAQQRARRARAKAGGLPLVGE